ncbi:DUF4232 domain-containing protein [Streptomyces sp. S6]
MRAQKLTFAAVAVVAGLSLTACSSSDDGRAKAGNDTSTTPVASVSTPNGGTATGGSAGTGSTTGGSGASGSTTGGGTKDGAGKATGGATGANSTSKTARCTTDGLTITAADRTISGDKDGTVVVTLKNRSGKSCTIGGYAGVDLKTTSGTISAKRTGQESVNVTLKNGAEIYFPISYPVNTSGGSGVRITGLLVTPPNDTKTVSLAWPGGASLPVTEGGGTPVKVGPVGSAGQGS